MGASIPTLQYSHKNPGWEAYGGFPKMGVPENGWFRRENPGWELGRPLGNHRKMGGGPSLGVPTNSVKRGYLVGGIHTYPSEKWWSSSVVMIIPNIRENKKCSKPPTSYDWSATINKHVGFFTSHMVGNPCPAYPMGLSCQWSFNNRNQWGNQENKVKKFVALWDCVQGAGPVRSSILVLFPWKSQETIRSSIGINW